MSNTNSILSMTEHGVYVWPSYGIVGLVLAILVVVSLRSLRRTSQALQHAEKEIGNTRDET